MSLAPDPISATSTESSGPAEALRRLRHDAAVARGLACFGAGMTIGVVFGVADTVALDAGREIDAWYQIAAAALAVGAVLSILVARAAVNLGAGIGRVLAATSLVSGGVWLALYNTGDPAAVDVLVAVGLGAAVPMVLLAGLDAVLLHPSARRIAAFGQPAAAALAGVGIGAFVMFVDPTLVWSDITTVGGAIALVGALRRLRLPSKVATAASASARPTSVDRSPAGVRIFLAVTVGIAAAGLVRVGPYLHDGWQAGVRYQLLTWALAGAVGTAIVIGAIWVPARRTRDAATEVDDAARLTALAGATMLIVAASQTLPGTVIGTGAAAGAAAATLVMLGAAGARGERGAGAAAVAVGVAGAAAWTATWVAWPTLLDALDSDRVVLAVIGLPAVVAGVMVWLRPVGATATAPADRVAAAPAWTAPVGSVRSASTATFDVSASMLPPPVIDLTVPVVTPPPFSNGSASRTTSKVLLDARGVEFSYGAVQVLFGVDLQVRQGEVVALLGTNGAGKTTFLRTVAGLASPSAGSIRLAGGDLARFSASDRVLLGVNQIAADAAVAPDLTVAENLAMFGHTLPRGEARAGADRAVAIFPRLGERLGQRASALSGGERQMLSLSKSIVLRPRLLIIDECTLGLAPIAVAMLVPVIRRLHEEGSSVLLVEQSVHLALDLASRACCMEKGRIVYESDADELRADPGLLEAVYLEGITAALEQRHGVHGQGPVAP